MESILLHSGRSNGFVRFNSKHLLMSKGTAECSKLLLRLCGELACSSSTGHELVIQLLMLLMSLCSSSFLPYLVSTGWLETSHPSGKTNFEDVLCPSDACWLVSFWWTILASPTWLRLLPMEHGLNNTLKS